MLVLPKATPGQPWRRLFQGDTLGARAAPAAATLTVSSTQLHVEVPFPRWVGPDDVRVKVEAHRLHIESPLGSMVRTIDCELDAAEATWDVVRGRASTVLTIDIPLLHSGQGLLSGKLQAAPSFEEDRDEFGLLDLLQAAVFAATGQAPLQVGSTATHEARLPAAARALLHVFRTVPDSCV